MRARQAFIFHFALGSALLFSGLSGCIDSSGLLNPANGLVLGTTATSGESAATQADAPAADDGADVAPGGDSGSGRIDSLIAEGDVGPGGYRMFDLGVSDAGDQWSLEPVGAQPAYFIVALFDENQNLLYRDYVGTGYGFEHILRIGASHLTLGVMPSSGSAGGAFRIRATRAAGAEIPAPQSQVVWLNFGGAQGVSVHGSQALSFGPFEGDSLGATYAGTTATLKQAIVEVVRADYAPYNVTIATSDDGPAPAGASIVHFGGYDSGLLGLADSVDGYNRVTQQNAIIYVDSFAPYEVMQLTPDEMGEMIGNVASHELGHLLGLYHTRDPNDVMDTTGTAWQLAQTQDFLRASLEPSVFAIGSEDSPTMLALSVGRRADAAKATLVARSRRPVRQWLQRFAAQESEAGCGTCLHLDDHLPRR